MGHKVILVAALACASLVGACDRRTAADGQGRPADIARDLAAATSGVGTAAVGAVTTETFVRDAAVGDLFEIEASQMALARSTTAGVRKAARMILGDHTASSARLARLVSGGQAPGPLPAALDARRREMLEDLRTAGAQDFDDRYIDQQTMAHHEALLLMQGYRASGTVAPLKAFAAEVEPKVRMHLDMVAGLGAPAPPGPAQSRVVR